MDTVLTAVALVGGTGVVLAVMLAIASRVLYVPAHEQAQRINDVLPGVNCGGCSYAGCHDYALAVAKGEAAPNLCVPGRDEVAQKIAGILGIEPEHIQEMVAVVACHGNYDNTYDKYIYSGIKTCVATSMYHQGRSVCAWGCIGYGDCVAACPYNAIFLKNGCAYTDFSLCVGCGACARKCPKHLIKLVPRSSRALVVCGNHDRGAVTRKLCKQGCIGCGRCTRVCPNGAIEVIENCAVVDFERCIACGLCVPECPVGALVTAQPALTQHIP